jgi:hypothetical protein
VSSSLGRRALIVLVAAIVLLPGAPGWMAAVGAAEGQLTKIGGNGPDTCLLAPSQFSNPPRPTAGIKGAGFNTSTGMVGLASDLHGNVLLLGTGGLVLAYDGIFAGTLTPGANEEDGGRATETAFPRMAGIAVDPGGNSLWILQQSVGAPTPGRIREVDIGTGTVTTFAETGPTPQAIAADGGGNVYVAEGGESTGVYRVARSGSRTALANFQANGIAVDLLGSQVYASGKDGNVYRLNGSTPQIVAGASVPHADGGSPTLSPIGLAIAYETDGRDLSARYLYIADQELTGKPGRVVRVDLKATPSIITTVAGGGSSFTISTPDAKTARIAPRFVATKLGTTVYIAAPDQCATFELQAPSPFRLNTVVTNPPAATNTTLPSGGSRTGDNESTAPDPAPSGNSSTNPQVDPGTGSQPAGQGATTEIVPGSQTNLQPQPQTELRIIDQSNVVTTPDQAVQPTVEPVPTPGPAAQFTPTPGLAAQVTPTPTPTPTPVADAGSVVASDPGPSSAVAADASPAVPPAPAPAPVPPAPASAPPPAAHQPVSNAGLAHGDSGEPTRGATRYAMVRNDDEQPIAALAMAGAGGLLAMFLCVMVVAPGAASKAKPRPRRAY